MTNRVLKLAPALSLPLAVVTQKLAWLGVTGSGKTYGASKLVELLLHAGAQVIVLDPVGVWYGLRLAAGGKKPSDITIPIFGGLHGDVPLEPTAGALVANLVVDKTLSAVLDVSQFESDTDKARFAKDFADRFFFRKKAAPSAVHLVLEECQEFVPQNPQRGEEHMLHAFVRLQKLGRNFGIGSSYVSQRPQEVNKKALNMAQTLFVFRTTGSHERDAIEKWIQDKALDEDIAGDLPKIPTGQCHVWSPEFLRISETVTIAEKETFNASATPEVGAAAVTRELAPIDLAKVAKDMAATIEKAKADDPRELRKRIKQLEDQVVGKAVTAVAVHLRDQKPALTDLDRGRLEQLGQNIMAAAALMNEDLKLANMRLRSELEHVAGEYVARVTAVTEKAERALAGELEKVSVQKILGKLVAVMPLGPQQRTPKSAGPRVPANLVYEGGARDRARPAAAGLDGAQQNILDVVAMLGVRGLDVNRESVARWLDIHPNGGRYGSNLAFLRAEGYLDGFLLTQKGMSVARAMATGLEAARTPLDGSQREILDALERHDGQLKFTRETLAQELGIHPNGGRYGSNLARLRTMGLIPDRGDIYLTEGAKR